MQCRDFRPSKKNVSRPDFLLKEAGGPRYLLFMDFCFSFEYGHHVLDAHSS